MELTRPFSGLGKDDAFIAGGKGASLGELTQAGIPVPPGYVVLAPTFERFLAETDLGVEIDAILATVKHEEMHTVEYASERIQALIHEATMPADIASDIEANFTALGADFVAVRSSATAEDSASAAWAGQLDSYLNTTHETLLVNVQRCWASLFTPRAIFYRFEKGLDTQKISVAVVVQKMVNSDAAGIAFSVHPVTEDYNQLIIEAGFGLGEAVVSGQVTPDSYVVTKEPREVIDTNISEQSRGLYRKAGGGNEWRELGAAGETQVLTQEEILSLSETIIRIEKHYGFPCDIEWAREGSEFYIVQSRPITTLSTIPAPAPSIILSKIFTRERPLFYYTLWHESDAEGAKRYVDHELKHDLFITPPRGQAGGVWYDIAEFDRIAKRGKEKLNASDEFAASLVKEMEVGWERIAPYLESDKKLESAEEMYAYYDGLLAYWLPMNSAFFSLPDDEGVNPIFREGVLRIREEKQEYTEKMSDVFLEFFETAFPAWKELSYYVTPKEVVTLAQSAPEALVAELRERARVGCFMLEGTVYPLTELENVLAQRGLALEQVDVREGEPLTGQIANKGYAKGLARIVVSKAQMANVQAGDILVTGMTTPDYLPAMKLAAAFVTDEGGLTCHAAIIAREMGKPCVIGTKIATQAISDGDTVEVDADTGIVRKL